MANKGSGDKKNWGRNENSRRKKRYCEREVKEQRKRRRKEK